ncbi:hypothetical protein F4859DRAFT_511755 [Xylaria cf. heliscus]|nr:hypothetical protein F4859DRAFT_511755 [Xylaria cf. heliscus]
MANTRKQATPQEWEEYLEGLAQSHRRPWGALTSLFRARSRRTSNVTRIPPGSHATIRTTRDSAWTRSAPCDIAAPNFPPPAYKQEERASPGDGDAAQLLAQLPRDIDIRYTEDDTVIITNSSSHAVTVYLDESGRVQAVEGKGLRTTSSPRSFLVSFLASLVLWLWRRIFAYNKEARAITDETGTRPSAATDEKPTSPRGYVHLYRLPRPEEPRG